MSILLLSVSSNIFEAPFDDGISTSASNIRPLHAATKKQRVARDKYIRTFTTNMAAYGTLAENRQSAEHSTGRIGGTEEQSNGGHDADNAISDSYVSKYWSSDSGEA